MTAQLTVTTGPPRCGKTAQLLTQYRDVLARNQPGAALWLSPSWRAAGEVYGQLLGGVCRGCFGPGVITFEKFADRVLELAPGEIRPMSRLMKRQLVAQLIDDQLAAGRLIHFRPIAGTGGLVDLVCDFIGELKRLEIWPEEFQRACNARGIAQKDLELLEIYDRYQLLLRERQLYDAEGRFWSARDLLGKMQSSTEPPVAMRPWERLRLVVADGFTDFTRTQHEIIEILARRVEQMCISLPLEAESQETGSQETGSRQTGPRRTDLFAKSLGTLSELRRRHPHLVHEELPYPDGSDWPAIAHVRRTLFTNPRHRQSAPKTTGIEILAAARQLGEIELIGARIKRLLVDEEAAPGDIAVVFRSPEQVGSLVGEVFGGMGIPVAFERGQTLDRSPALRALAALLRLDVEDWPFRDLLAVLGGNYFQPAWPEWRPAVTATTAERAIRRLQIPRGRQRLIERLRSLGDDAAGDDVAAVLARLGAALDELPHKATPAGWSKAWATLAQQTGLLQTVQQSAPQAGVPDGVAWHRLQRLLSDANTLSQWLEQHPPEWNRREALAALLDILAGEQVGSGDDESGRVRVLSAVSVRALQIPYLFVAGLSEKAFPPPDREDRLYGEAEYQRLIDEGLPLVARTERNREEMLLFYEVVTRATKRLYLSYPALDESAQPLSPSPFLEELEQVCGAERTEIADLSPVPPGDEPFSPSEFRVKAMATAIDGDVSLLAGLLADGQWNCLSQQILAGLQLAELRRGRKGFSVAEGMFDGDAARQRLAADFTTQRTYSATELEQYASCPYRFFIERVLKLKAVDELALTVDYMQRGRLAHEVLATFHRRVNRALDHPGSPVELEAAQCARLASETLDELFAAAEPRGVRAAMREIDRRLMVRWMADYRRQHERYDKLWEKCDLPPVPELFEVSFGRETDGEDPPSTDKPLELSAAGQTFRISGRVDRIDVGRMAGRTIFNVVDYKTGGSSRFSLESVVAGTALQLPLYSMAVAELLLARREAVPWQAGYWYVRDDGFKPRQALKMHRRDGDALVPEADWQQIRPLLADTVAALVEGIRRGEFPVCSRDEHCTGFCPYSTVCRINQVRSLEKRWQPAVTSQ